MLAVSLSRTAIWPSAQPAGQRRVGAAPVVAAASPKRSDKLKARRERQRREQERMRQDLQRSEIQRQQEQQEKEQRQQAVALACAEDPLNEWLATACLPPEVGAVPRAVRQRVRGELRGLVAAVDAKGNDMKATVMLWADMDTAIVASSNKVRRIVIGVCAEHADAKESQRRAACCCDCHCNTLAG